MSSHAEDWIDARLGGVPEEFRPWLEWKTGLPGGDVGREGAPAPGPGRLPDVVETLASRGLDALARAAARPGRDRESAFLLLAADAYLTWACEALLEGGEPTTGLQELIRRIAAEGA